MHKYYNKEEILTLIDKRFGYEFEGKEKDDHLISPKAWNKYYRDFFEAKEDKLYGTLKHDEWDKIDSLIDDEKNRRTKSNNRYKKYREDLVEDIIAFREKQLIDQRNGNRKTTIDHHAIKMFEHFAEVLGTKVDENIYKKRIPKTKYNKMKNERIPAPTKEEIMKKKEQLVNIIFEQLIDEDKFNDDIQEHFMSNNLIHGVTNPLEAIEDGEGLLGFQIDAKNYIKENVKREILNNIKE